MVFRSLTNSRKINRPIRVEESSKVRKAAEFKCRIACYNIEFDVSGRSFFSRSALASRCCILLNDAFIFVNFRSDSIGSNGVFVDMHVPQGFIYEPEISFVFYSNQRIISRSKYITIKLIEVTKTVVLLQRSLSAFCHFEACSRFNIHQTAVNNSVAMTFNPIDDQLILLSLNSMASGLS